jgi:hypothetical protein
MQTRARELRDWVINPVTKLIGAYKPSATALLLGTAATETHFGKWLHQGGGGPARGIFQIETNNPNSGHDLIMKWLDNPKRKHLFDRIWGLRSNYSLITTDQELTFNLAYQVAIARCLYLSIPRPLPKPHDVKGMAIYWKKYYNSPLGKGTEQQFIDDYNRFVLGK